MAFMKFSKGKPLLLVPNGIGDGTAYFVSSGTYIKDTIGGIPSGSNPFSLSIWFRKMDSNYETDLVSWGIGELGKNLSLYFQSSNNITVAVYGSGQRVATYEVGKWHNIIITQNGDSYINFYLDGAYVTSWRPAHILNLSPTNFGFCNSRNPAYNGFVKDVLVYNRALSAEEVTTLYNHGAVTDGLVLNIPLQYGKDDESIFSSKSFVYDYAILTTSSGFDEWGYPIRYDIASECGISYKGSYYVPNDTDTLVLYQPKANDTEVVNYAKGASKLLYEPKNYGVTVADGKLQFDGEVNSYIEFLSNSFPEGCFDTLGEFTVDMWFDNQKTSICCLFGTTKGSNGSSRMDWLTNINTGEVPIGGFKNLKNSGEPYTKFRLTLEVWLDNGNSVFASYVNGKKQNSGNWTLNSRSLALCLGYDNETSSRRFKGNMAFFSIRSKADHKGVDFEVKENPYV